MLETTLVGFGDSLTAGYGVPGEAAHMTRLAAELPKRYPDISWKIINSGANGDTTREGLSRLTRDVLRHDPNIVLILFGSNDSALDEYQYRTPAEFRNNLNKIVAGIEGLRLSSGQNGGRALPVLITPPPVKDIKFFPYTTNERVKKYAQIVREVAAAHGAPVFDFHDYVYEKTYGNFKHLIQYDGVHLNEEGYDLLFRCVLEGIAPLLDKRGVLIEQSRPGKDT